MRRKSDDELVQDYKSVNFAHIDTNLSNEFYKTTMGFSQFKAQYYEERFIHSVSVTVRYTIRKIRRKLGWN